jgi:hypothetical protein
MPVTLKIHRRSIPREGGGLQLPVLFILYAPPFLNPDAEPANIQGMRDMPNAYGQFVSEFLEALFAPGELVRAAEELS